MRKRNILSLARAILLASMFGMSMALPAMPTAEEIAAAEPLVQEVMKAETEALRRGKKTREQVGDAALKFAAQAQAPAEKYLLLTTAFEQYMRGGAYDKANSALASLRRAIPDLKGKDEYALIDKWLRMVPSGKGDAVRARYDALKERQQFASRLKRALAQSKKRPTDKKLHFQIASYYAALNNWRSACEFFLHGNSAACASAAKLELSSTPTNKIADAWWDASDTKPDFLSSAIRSHAISLYTSALADKSFTGLQRVVAERRVAEYISGQREKQDTKSKHQESYSSKAKVVGVELVGKTVRERGGVLSCFGVGSYAQIKGIFAPQKKAICAVLQFTTGQNVDSVASLMGCKGDRPGFLPFHISKGGLVSSLSSNGKSWNLIQCMDLGLSLSPNTTYRIKCSWDREKYEWAVFESGNWRMLKSVQISSPVYSGTELLIGTNRAGQSPFSGTIDLTMSYILVDGELWWEGAKGAYKE